MQFFYFILLSPHIPWIFSALADLEILKIVENKGK